MRYLAYLKNSGLLFADDAVIFADSEENLRENISRIREWCGIWEMKLNVEKCGIMELGINVRQDLNIKIGGLRIPLVNEYIYLGILIKRNLDMENMVKRNLEKGRKCFYAIRPFLINHNFSIYFRVKALKGILLPILLYGSELFGMSTYRLRKVQTLINSACRSLLNTNPNTPTKLCNMNLGIKNIDFLSARNRLRGLNKWVEAKTPIRNLITHPLRSRKATWVSGGNRWKRRFVSTDGLSINEALETEFLSRERHVTLTELDNEESGVNIIAPVIKFSIYYPDLKIGLNYLIGIRIGKIKPAWRLSNMRLISREYLNKCPFCGIEEKEDWLHVLFRCSNWDMYRTDLWLATGLTIDTPLCDDTLVEAMRGLFGEEFNSRLVKDETHPSVVKLQATVRYLAVVIPLRAVIISRLRSEQLAASRNRSLNDMATLGKSYP